MSDGVCEIDFHSGTEKWCFLEREIWKSERLIMCVWTMIKFVYLILSMIQINWSKLDHSFWWSNYTSPTN